MLLSFSCGAAVRSVAAQESFRVPVLAGPVACVDDAADLAVGSRLRDGPGVVGGGEREHAHEQDVGAGARLDAMSPYGFGVQFDGVRPRQQVVGVHSEPFDGSGVGGGAQRAPIARRLVVMCLAACVAAVFASRAGIEPCAAFVA
ncbi:hypothetical protein PMN46_04435 [Bifidobacterium longum]|nr:hypothetical protein [Bifidobacterium longum]